MNFTEKQLKDLAEIMQKNGRLTADQAIEALKKSISTRELQPKCPACFEGRLYHVGKRYSPTKGASVQLYECDQCKEIVEKNIDYKLKTKKHARTKTESY